jgi:ABC-type multidrug transport system fused ATPase/permease subunit
LKEVNLGSYYRYVGYLSQEPPVFDGTVHENLVYGLENGTKVSVEKIQSAIEQAQCDFIHTLPNGIETEIGEK